MRASVRRANPFGEPPAARDTAGKATAGVDAVRFVTSNEEKFREVARLLRARGVEVDHLGVAYPEVQGDALEEVVSAALGWLGRRHEDDLLVDDSGLFIQSLKGFPGVYSAYVYRTLGCEGVLKLLEGTEDRAAVFEACLGLRRGDGTHLFHGRCAGSIAHEVRGTGGFGFDPVFVPEGHDRTFAEMIVEEKNAVSHRGRAADALARWLGGG